MKTKKRKLPTLVKSLATKSVDEITIRLAEIKQEIADAEKYGNLARACVLQNARWAYEQALLLKK